MNILSADQFTEKKNEIIQQISENKIYVEVPPTGGAIEYDLSSFNKDLWIENKYIVADVYHECHDVLVLIFKFLQEDKKHINIHFGILPYVNTRLCLPLEALNGEKLFLDRYPGVLQTVLRGDHSIKLNLINKFTIETIPSTTNRSFQLSNVHLRKDEPIFLEEPQEYIDHFGQLQHKNWKNKIKDTNDLHQTLRNEWKQCQNHPYDDPSISTFGGWKQKRFAATGYFRTEYDGENWWFVDPEGYATFSLGINCMTPTSAMHTKGMKHLTSWLPGRETEFSEAWHGENFDYGISNMIRAFGNEWYDHWVDVNTKRLKEWKVNTIGNWSQKEFIERSKIPYVYPMRGFPTTEEKIYRDFPDVYSSEYENNARIFAKQLESFRDDKYLIGYFLRNEPHWAFVDELNLTELMLLHPHPFASKTKFLENLREKYVTIDQLNKAWKTDFDHFTDLKDPNKVQITNTLKQMENFKWFNQKLIRRYVEIPTKRCKEVDPNHLNLGMRYAWISNEDLLAGCELFDVFSINSYARKPDREHIQKISKKLNKPVMIGEFHFGAADVGMLAYGIRAVNTQKERGLAYRYYVEQAATIPELIGVHYFQFNDQPVLGRFDGENYQIGVIDVCQQPYEEFVNEMKLSHERVYDIRTGVLEPLATPPCEIPKTGF